MPRAAHRRRRADRRREDERGGERALRPLGKVRRELAQRAADAHAKSGDARAEPERHPQAPPVHAQRRPVPALIEELDRPVGEPLVDGVLGSVERAAHHRERHQHQQRQARGRDGEPAVDARGRGAGCGHRAGGEGLVIGEDRAQICRSQEQQLQGRAHHHAGRRIAQTQANQRPGDERPGERGLKERLPLHGEQPAHRDGQGDAT